MMDWSAWKICHANVHLMSNICLKFQVNIFKTVEVVHIRRFCEIVLQCKKKWSDPHGNMSSTSSFHAEQMYKVWSHCFENSRSSSCHNFLIYSAPFKKKNGLIHMKNMSPTSILNDFSFNWILSWKCISSHHKILLNHSPPKNNGLIQMKNM